jgi:hypothetical protein
LGFIFGFLSFPIIGLIIQVLFKKKIHRYFANFLSILFILKIVPYLVSGNLIITLDFFKSIIYKTTTLFPDNLGVNVIAVLTYILISLAFRNKNAFC